MARRPEAPPIELMQEYVRSTVLPRLKADDTRGLHLSATELGNRNRIYFLDIPGRDPLILKGFRKKKRLHNHVLSARFLRRCGIPVPEAVFADRSERNHRRLGYYFSAETRLSGSPLALTDDPDRVIDAVAPVYADLHRHRSSRWGLLGAQRRTGFRSYILRKSYRHLETLTRTNVLDTAEADHLSAWLAQSRNSIRAIPHYSLCHGDVNARNIMLTDSGTAAIIDTEGVRYLPFPLELYRLSLYLFGDTPALQARFEETYLRHCPARRRTELDTGGEFFRAYVLLEIAAYATRTLERTDNPVLRGRRQAALDALLAMGNS